MRRHLILMVALIAPLALAACGGIPEGTAPININQVLDRTAKRLVKFDEYLRRYDYKEIDQAMYDQFNTTIQHDLNAKPRFHSTKILTNIRKDASILGHGDLNANGKVDEKEPLLFKIEFDGDNNRIIVTSAAHRDAVGRPVRGGFFAGVMIGSIMNRQTSSGIKRGHFNGRNVAGAPVTNRKVASRGRSRARGSARSAARSGGLRGGK